MLAAAGAVVTAPAAVACSCASEPSDVTAADRADAVFSGVLVGRDEPRGLVRGSADGARLTFEVGHVYAGQVADVQVVLTASTGASCGWEMTGEGPFLVFARLGSDGIVGAAADDLVTGLCDGSRQLSPDEVAGGVAALSPPAPPGPGLDRASGPDAVLAWSLLALAVPALATLVVAVVRQARNRQTPLEE